MKAAEDEIIFYEEKIKKLTKDDVDFSIYRYLGRFRNFGNSLNFVEVNFLLNRKTRESLQWKKKLAQSRIR